MSVTKDYKVVTLSREQSFAAIRALRARHDQLQALWLQAEGDMAAQAYLHTQLTAAWDAFEAVTTASFKAAQA